MLAFAWLQDGTLMLALLRQAFRRWLDRRIPAQNELILNQRRIFILPSRQGMVFLLVLLLLLLAAINYQNNLIYLLVFLLASMANSAMLLSYLNVAGLRLKQGKTQACYAGDYNACVIELGSSKQRYHQQIHLSWPDNPVQLVSIRPSDYQLIELHHLSAQRGIHRAGRILLESYYPLGFFRTWSWIDLAIDFVVYPTPSLPNSDVAKDSLSREGQDKISLFADEFYSFRAYQPGDAPRHINWRSLAKGLPLQSKVYADKQGRQTWVDYALLTGTVEQRLSQMCGWALQLEKQQVVWGLRLPNGEIAQASGDAHLQQGLYALAAYHAG